MHVEGALNVHQRYVCVVKGTLEVLDVSNVFEVPHMHFKMTLKVFIRMNSCFWPLHRDLGDVRIVTFGFSFWSWCCEHAQQVCLTKTVSAWTQSNSEPRLYFCEVFLFCIRA